MLGGFTRSLSALVHFTLHKGAAVDSVVYIKRCPLSISITTTTRSPNSKRWAKGPKRSPHEWLAHLSYGVRSTPGDATSAETGLVLIRWRGAGDVAASQGLADGQAIAAKHRQGDAARHLASERCMGRGRSRGENKNRRLSACGGAVCRLRAAAAADADTAGSSS